MEDGNAAGGRTHLVVKVLSVYILELFIRTRRGWAAPVCREEEEEEVNTLQNQESAMGRILL